MKKHSNIHTLNGTYIPFENILLIRREEVSANSNFKYFTVVLKGGEEVSSGRLGEYEIETELGNLLASLDTYLERHATTSDAYPRTPCPPHAPELNAPAKNGLQKA